MFTISKYYEGDACIKTDSEGTKGVSGLLTTIYLASQMEEDMV